jgi:hypothetical protein
MKNVTTDKKQRTANTAPTKKAGFRVPKTVLSLNEHQFFKSSFVVNVPSLG